MRAMTHLLDCAALVGYVHVYAEARGGNVNSDPSDVALGSDAQFQLAHVSQCMKRWCSNTSKPRRHEPCHML